MIKYILLQDMYFTYLLMVNTAIVMLFYIIQHQIKYYLYINMLVIDMDICLVDYNNNSHLSGKIMSILNNNV